MHTLTLIHKHKDTHRHVIVVNRFELEAKLQHAKQVGSNFDCDCLRVICFLFISIHYFHSILLLSLFSSSLS